MNPPRSGRRAARAAMTAPTPPLMGRRRTTGGRILRAVTRGVPVFAVVLIAAMLILPTGLVGAEDAASTDDQEPDVVATVVAESDDPVVEDPVVEDPVVEDPVVEDPVVEDPVVEDPVVEDPVVEDPVVEDPVVEDPVVDAEDPQTDDPDATPDADPDTADPDPSLVPGYESGINVTMFTCPGPFAGDLDLLLQNCPVSSDTNFDIYGPELTLSSQGGIALNALPAGDYRIRASFPAGFRTPTAFCGLGPADQPPGPLSPVVVIEGYYEFNLPQGQALFCDWFNVPAASQTGGEILINNHFCPAAAVFDASTASIYDLTANCQEPAAPVSFLATQNGQAIAGGTANGAPDLLGLEVPVGEIVVTEALPEGFDAPVVYCSVKDDLGNSRASQTAAPVDNDRIFWTVNDGDVVFCDWFNVPAERGVTISVIKHTCPSGLRLVRGGFEAYAGACPTATEGVSFKLDGASTGNPGEQLTDAYGHITWSEMEADHYYLTEDVPAGYRTPVVYCNYYDPAALMVPTPQAYPVDAQNRIEFDVADGQFITCSWFNIPSH